MPSFVSKPVEIEAWRYRPVAPAGSTTEGGVDRTFGELAQIEGLSLRYCEEGGRPQLWVAKSEAWCDLPPGSWVIAEPDGSGFYPCAGDIFEARWTAPEAERLLP